MILMGLVQKLTSQNYETTDVSVSTPYFSIVMSKNRVMETVKFFILSTMKHGQK